MTGAHWLILAATTVAAVLCLWWTRRRPRVWRQEEVDEIRRRARERSEQTRQWVDEPGDQTHEQIDQALDIASEPQTYVAGTAFQWHAHEQAKAAHTDAAMRRLIGDSPISEDRKAGLLGEWHDRLEHPVPWPHLTAEEAADCTLCSPSNLPRRTEGGDERG